VIRFSPTTIIRNPDHPVLCVIVVMTELRRVPYCLFNVLILGSLEELTFRKQKVSLTFIIPSPSCSLPRRGEQEEEGTMKKFYVIV